MLHFLCKDPAGGIVRSLTLTTQQSLFMTGG